MYRETRYFYQRICVLIDVALCAAAFFLAHWLRNHALAPMGLLSASDMFWYRPLLALTPPLAVLFWYHNGFYRIERLFRRREMLRSLAISVIEIVSALAFIDFFFFEPSVDAVTGAVVHGSRGQFLLHPVVATFLVWARGEVTRWWLERRRRRGHAIRNILLVGSGENLRRFVQAIMGHPLWGFRIEGLVTDHANLFVDDRILGHRVITTLHGLGDYLEQHAVDDVIFVPGETPLDELAVYITECELMGVRTRLSLNFISPTLRGASLDSFENIPVITYNVTPEVGAGLVLKWTIDRLAAAAGLIALAPLFLAIAASIKREGPRHAPVFFKQRRLGQNGRAFSLYKFRTMRPGAEAELEQLREYNEADGPRFKIAADPRVTEIGRFLRKYSLDELPQLWNVARGDMSLVGPRPPLAEEVARYTRAQRRRLSMKPGMTCLWAVRGRDRLDWEKFVEYDLEYIDNWSLWLDLKIAARTAAHVVRGKDAS